MRVSPGKSSSASAFGEKGKWKVFSDAQVAASFKPVPTVELSVPDTSVDFVVKTLMQPKVRVLCGLKASLMGSVGVGSFSEQPKKWWEAEDKYSSTTVSLLGSLSQGRVIFLRNVKQVFLSLVSFFFFFLFFVRVGSALV